MLFIVCGELFVVCGFVEYCLLFGACACYVMLVWFAVCCLLFFVGCGFLFVLCCPLPVVCRVLSDAFYNVVSVV